MIQQQPAVQSVADYKEQSCLHCTTPLTPTQLSGFCCNGCEVVYTTIRSLGLENYYQLKTQSGSPLRRPITEVSKSYAIYDDVKFVERFTRLAFETETVREVTFFLAGIHCAACVWILEKLPELNSGVISARVEFGRAILRVQYIPAATSLGAIASLLHSLGYSPTPILEGNETAPKRAANRITLLRIGVAALCTMNVMMMALSIYQGQLSGIEAPYQNLFSWVSLLLTLPVVGFSAVPFYRTAIGGLKSGVLHIDLPIVIAILAAFAYSVLNTLSGNSLVYYDSVCALVLLLLCGRWLQHRSVERVLDATTLLYALAPRSARLAETGEERFVESILPDARVVIENKETVAVDGMVISGAAKINTALLTGESVPHSISAGSRVFAGSKLEGGSIVVAVEATGSNSRLGRLMKTLEETAHQRAPIELFLDRVSKGFIAVVLVAAAATFWWWSAVEGSTRAFECAVALLVVSCPCVLAVATPLNFSLALAQAAKRGILIKSAESIESLTKIKNLLIDKTGTITNGCMRIVTIAAPTADGSWKFLGAGERLSAVGLSNGIMANEILDLIKIAQQLESTSYHPIAEAIRAFAVSGTGEATPPVTERKTLPGIGVEAKMDGVIWSMQSGRSLAADSINTSAIKEIRDRGASSYASEAFLCCAGIPKLLFLVGDTVRTESKLVLDQLRERYGLSIEILSGDSPSIVSKVANEVGVSQLQAHGYLDPEEKQRRAALSEAKNPTAFVGDGANDAAALTACSVGIAVHGGAEVSLAVSDAYLSAPGLNPLLALFDGAHRTIAVVKLSLMVSVLYNIIGGSAAILGYIGPLEAAILMPISSLSTISIAIFSRKFR